MDRFYYNSAAGPSKGWYHRTNLQFQETTMSWIRETEHKSGDPMPVTKVMSINSAAMEAVANLG